MITIVNYFTNIIISLLGELNGNFDGATTGKGDNNSS